MRYAALAVDYDGTLACSGRVASETVHALERLAASGRKLILASGRELEELLAVFPELEVFDRVVAENGAVLYTPGTRMHRTLGDPPSPQLVRELERRGVQPLSVGRSIIATVQSHETVALEAIRHQGLELDVIFNKGAVMILPASVNKATGLAAALDELALSPRNVVAIGDAENDHALLRAAEYGVAVANALPTLKRAADRSSRYENGRAVIELVDDLIRHDLRATPPRVPRRDILLGKLAGGRELRMPPAWFSVLIAGARSTLARGLIERIAAEGYQFCAIEAMGNYVWTPDVIVLGANDRAPAAADVIRALQKPDINVAVRLSGLSQQLRSAFLADLMRRLSELRGRVGRPHWVLVDPLQELRDTVPDALTDSPGGMIYLTACVDRCIEQVLPAVDLAVVVGGTPSAKFEAVAASWGVAAPAIRHDVLEEGEALAWQRGIHGEPLRFRIASPRA